MTQDTRKDPRAKVLTMTVRYKSATLDEFIEHHSHDVSRGGMFIKTPSPFPPGTLLKFEVKIAAEQRVMQGVGRVVWKREASDSSDVRPSGMGVKFIKIDDESRKVIDQLVLARGEAESNFDQGGADAPAAAATREESKPAVVPTPSLPAAAKAGGARKQTMIGLGAMSSGAPGPTPATSAAPAKPEPKGGFFPESSLDDMPPPEDRTVMKQAAELLQDALREAGGSLDEVGTSAVQPQSRPATSAASSAKVPFPAAGLGDDEPTRAMPAAERAAADGPASSKPRPAPIPAQPEPVKAQPAKPAPAPKPVSAAHAKLAQTIPAHRPARPAAAAQPAAAEGGGGKVVLGFAAVAAVAGIVYFAMRKDEPPPAAPDTPAAEVAQPTPAPPSAAPEPPPAAQPAEPPSAAPAPVASEVPAAAAPAGATGLAAPPVAAPPAAPEPAAPAAAAPAAPKVRPKAKVKAETTGAEPSAPAAPPAAAPVAPAEPKPAEPPKAAAPAEPAEPKPAPKPAAPKPAAPKPAAPAGDNPY